MTVPRARPELKSFSLQSTASQSTRQRPVVRIWTLSSSSDLLPATKDCCCPLMSIERFCVFFSCPFCSVFTQMSLTAEVTLPLNFLPLVAAAYSGWSTETSSFTPPPRSWDRSNASRGHARVCILPASPTMGRSTSGSLLCHKSHPSPGRTCGCAPRPIPPHLGPQVRGKHSASVVLRAFCYFTNMD